ncbi:MAG: carboxylating nicotinate-nucleotide diphosphorylase [Planctomycetota bacterium]
MHSFDAIEPNEVSLPDLARALMRSEGVFRLIALARDEDLGVPPRDFTGELMFDATDVRTVRLASRADGVLAGLACVPGIIDVFRGEHEDAVSFEPHAQDGDTIRPGQALARLAGSARALVRLERTMLNLVARMSGVATRTARFVAAVEGTGVTICDTRKTTPGMRLLEKYSVRCGGGSCHRIGLHDAVLIKDNHIAGLSVFELADTLAKVATEARGRGGLLRFIQVEVDHLDQLDRVLGLPNGLIDLVLLDNMPPEMLRDAVARRDEEAPSLLLEASGGVTLDTVRSIAETGVDRVSVGGLTHQAVSLDLGLDAT